MTGVQTCALPIWAKLNFETGKQVVSWKEERGLKIQEKYNSCVFKMFIHTFVKRKIFLIENTILFKREKILVVETWNFERSTSKMNCVCALSELLDILCVKTPNVLFKWIATD